MKRDLNALQNTEFDLVVIGAGIYGAALAWEAAGRGLRVAVLEKGDFAGATSANSLKTIHGGFRYLQHLDFLRMRQSMLERRTLMHIAPHLVHPLPVLVPVYGHGIKGREALSAALLLNDLLGFDRNHLEDLQKHIGRGKMLSPGEVLQALPGIKAQGLTGGAVFYDAQVYNSERLVLAFVQSAEEAGARVANYAQVVDFVPVAGRAAGVRVRDVLTGGTFEVRARLVVNTAGPWIGQVLELGGAKAPFPLAKAVNLVTRRLFDHYAVGLMGNDSYADAASLVNKGTSLLFVSPWRETSLVGTSYENYSGDPGALQVEAADVGDLLQAINRAYPPANLTRKDVSYVHAGLLPAVRPGAKGQAVQLTHHYHIQDHRSEGLPGVISVTGVKYTTARQVAVDTVNRIFGWLGRERVPSVSANTRLPGGNIPDFQGYLSALVANSPCGLDEQQVKSLVYNYGANYGAVLRYFEPSAPDGRRLSLDQAFLSARVRHAVQDEMALKLGDVIFRRTDLGTARRPQPEDLELAGQVMAGLLGWSPQRSAQERAEVDAVFGWQDQG